MRWQKTLSSQTTFKPWTKFDHELTSTINLLRKTSPILCDLLSLSSPPLPPLIAFEPILLCLPPTPPLTFSHNQPLDSHPLLSSFPNLGPCPASQTIQTSVAVCTEKAPAPIGIGLEIPHVDTQDEHFWAALPRCRQVAAEFTGLFQDPGMAPRVCRMLATCVAGMLMTVGGVGVAVMPGGVVCMKLEKGVGREEGMVLVRVSSMFGGGSAGVAVAAVMRVAIMRGGRDFEWIRRVCLGIGKTCFLMEGGMGEGIRVLKGCRRVVERGRGWIGFEGGGMVVCCLDGGVGDGGDGGEEELRQVMEILGGEGELLRGEVLVLVYRGGVEEFRKRIGEREKAWECGGTYLELL